MKTTPTPSPKRKPQRFGRTAKIVVSALATTTLLGGWNLIAHLDSAQADAAAKSATPALPTLAPTATGQAATPTPLVFPTLAPLTIASVPTLRPAPNLSLPGVTTTVNAAAFTTLEMPALAPLPTMAPLPSMPNLPPPPAPSHGGSSNGGGSNNSGGGASSGGS